MEGSQNYLVLVGPYGLRTIRHIPSAADLAGLDDFYGSVAVLAGTVIIGEAPFLVVPWEERNLEARFGDMYLQYKHSVPRWLGRRSR